MAYEDEGKKSVFNAGVAQTERIDSLQKAVNSCRFNPTAFNQEVGRYNYELMVSANDGLLAEVWAKLSPNEKVQGKRIQELMVKFMEQNKIIYYYGGEQKINLNNLKKFNVLITLYERMNKQFLDDHNLNAPNWDEDDGEL